MIKSRYLLVLLIGFGMFLGSCQQEEPQPSAPVAPLTVNDPAGEDANDPPVEVLEGSVPTESEIAEPVVEAAEPEVVEEVVVEVVEVPVAEPGNTAVLQPGSTVQHQVQAGDWLVQIARCYGTEYTAVLQANPQLANPNWLLPGMMLTIPNVGSLGEAHGTPCVAEYTVAFGDTWFGLAERFGTTAVILQRVNPGPLLAADKIIVPAHDVTTELD